MLSSLTNATYRGAALAITAIVIAGCTHPRHPAAPSRPETPTAGTSASPTPPSPPPTATQPPPGPHASPAALAEWIQAGKPVDANAFRTVTLRGDVTTLAADDVAFRPPGRHNDDDVAGCVTGPAHSPELVCLPALKDPPKRPPAPGQWEGNWVSFDGASITVGSFHGDPGPFNNGSGKPLNYGDTISFGDYQCRSDPTGMYCLSRSHHCGLAMSSTVTAYGCVEQKRHSGFVGRRFTCD